MKLIKNNIGNGLLGLLLVLLVSGLLRLLALGSVPYGIANDEVSYILSGHTIATSGGEDIAGKFLPLSVNLDSSLSPVPVYLIAVFTGILGLEPFTARLPFALMGIGIVVLVYQIALSLFENRRAALFSALTIALSPWHILITRGAWDVIPAQFFYLLGFLIFIKKIKKGSVLWSLPAFLLGFFSYHGTKVFFVFFVTLLVIVFRKELLRRKKELVLFIVGVFAILSIFGAILVTQSVTRQEEIIFTNKSVIEEASKKINYERSKSSAPEFLKRIESNKAIFIAEKISSNYLNAFSAHFLFLIGDIQPIYGYGIFFKGVLYLIDLPFLILGLIYLVASSRIFQRNNSSESSSNLKSAFILIVGGLLISPLPSTIGSGYSYIIRSFMMVPFLSLICGIGVSKVWDFLEKKRVVGVFIACTLVLIYVLFVTRFVYQYYYQFNTFGGEFWNRSSRELSEYILNNSSKYNNIFVASSEDKVFLQYALSSKATPDDLQVAWKKNWPVKIGKVTFINSCFPDEKLLTKVPAKTLYVTNAYCHAGILPKEKILDPLEPLRVIWKIYEF